MYIYIYVIEGYQSVELAAERLMKRIQLHVCLLRLTFLCGDGMAAAKVDK